MAARKHREDRAWTPEKVRQRIRTGLLTRRLTDHALGKQDMSATQVAAALGLLKKTLPDLSATEFSGELRHRDVSDEPLTAEQWEQQHCLAPPSGPSESTH